MNQLDALISNGTCGTVKQGNACLAAGQVDLQARTKATLTQPGDQIAADEISTLQTIAPDGVVVILGGTSSNPVRLIAYNDSTSGDGRVVVIRSRNGGVTCQRAPAGMNLQSPSGQTGTMIINGIVIQWG